jgi:hypothetical protein
MKGDDSILKDGHMTIESPGIHYRVDLSPVRALVRPIVDGVARGQGTHLEVVFSDGSTHHTAPGETPDVTIVFRRRAAEWRMVFEAAREIINCFHITFIKGQYAPAGWH